MDYNIIWSYTQMKYFFSHSSALHDFLSYLSFMYTEKPSVTLKSQLNIMNYQFCIVLFTAWATLGSHSDYTLP